MDGEVSEQVILLITFFYWLTNISFLLFPIIKTPYIQFKLKLKTDQIHHSVNFIKSTNQFREMNIKFINKERSENF